MRNGTFSLDKYLYYSHTIPIPEFRRNIRDIISIRIVVLRHRNFSKHTYVVEDWCGH